MHSILLLLWLFLFASVSADSRKWDCDHVNVTATVNQEMEPIACRIRYNTNPYIFPSLPAGVTARIVDDASGLRIVISGTPTVALQTTLFTLKYAKEVTFLHIGVIGKPASLNYGFDYMVVYAGLPMEPLYPRSDAMLASFTITPSLPQGVAFDPHTGIISGSFPDESTSGVQYSVTGSNGMGSVSTSFRFIVASSGDMTENGFTSCHWLVSMECTVPPEEFFYTTPPTLCQHEMQLAFNNTFEERVYPWPGLDSRFQINYVSQYYGFLNIIIPGMYTFSLRADDNAVMYVDSLEKPLIKLRTCYELTNDTATIQLSKGRHIFLVRYTQVTESAVLDVRVSSADAGIDNQVLDSRMTKVGGRGPTFISYSPIVGYAGVALQGYTPERSSGVVDSWSVAPALPDGFVFNTATGEISGRPTHPYTGDHVVTAVAVNGAAQTVIRVQIGDSPIPGFRAKYYQFMEERGCTYSSFAPSFLRLRVDKIDSQIDFTPLPGIWSGLPSSSPLNYVEWEGFLHFTEVGDWGLRLGCAGACRLWSKDTLMIDLWTAKVSNYCHDFDSREVVVPVSYHSYYYVKIIYFRRERGDGIKLEWRSPKGDWSVVPADKIFNAPPRALSYDVEKMDYFKDVQIQSNQPHLMNTQTCSNFFASPPLPQGLMIGKGNGIITGIPSTAQSEAYYTITCSTNDGELSTTLRIAVHQLDPPSDVSVLLDGHPVEQEVVMYYAFKKTGPQVTVNKVDESLYYTITPELPRGLSLNPFSGALVGVAIEARPTVTYTFTATSPSGSCVATVRMTVMGCHGIDGDTPWSNEFLIMRLLDGATKMRVLNNNTDVQCSFGNYDGNNLVFKKCSRSLSVGKVIPICVKPDPNNLLYIESGIELGSHLHLFQPNGLHWPTLFLFNQTDKWYKKTIPFPTAPSPLTTVTLSSHELTAYKGISIPPVTITPDGGYRSVSIVSSNGATIPVDPLLPVLQGELHGDGTVIYTVTVTGESNSVSATLSIHFKDCNDDGRTMVTMGLYVALFAREISYYVYKGEVSTSSLVLSRQAMTDKTMYKDSICADEGEYVLVMKGTYGDGWSQGSYLNQYNDFGQIEREYTFKREANATKEKHVPFTLSSGRARISWKLNTHTNPGEKWKSADFDDSAWSETGLEEDHGSWSQNAIYLRYAFTLKNVTLYQVVQFGLWFKDGAIVYLNGNEVYRRNMAKGPATPDAWSSSSFEDYCLYPSSAPGYFLVEGVNVLAAEIHRAPTTSGTIHVFGYVNPVRGESVSRVYDGYIIEPPYFNSLNESSIAAWDGSGRTQWISNTVPTWTVYAFNYGREEWVNRLSLRVSEENGNYPISVRLSGSKDGVEWTTLFSRVEYAMFKKSLYREFLMMDHLDSFSQYKFEVLDSDSDKSRVSLSDIDLKVSPVNYCVMNDGFHGTLPNTTSITPCPSGFIGDMYRDCTLLDAKPVWKEADRSECHSTRPPWRYIYVDMVFAMTKESADHLHSLRHILEKAFSQATVIDEKRIEVWKTKDVSEEYPEYPIVTAFWIRVTALTKEKEVIAPKVSGSLYAYEKFLTTLYKEEFVEGFSIFVYQDAVVRDSKNLTPIIVSVVITFVFLCLVGFVLWIRLKPNRTVKRIKKHDAYAYTEDKSKI